MTLMNSGKRRCDSRCYGAKGKGCNCVCGGENHGIGFDAAMKNTKEHGDEMAKIFRSKNPDRDVTIHTEE